MLSSLARCSISIGLLDRPLVAACAMGLCTNTLEIALPLGAVLELFWIDVLRLGAVIPPSATLSFLLLYTFTLIFNWQVPSQIIVPLLFCLPLAYSVRWLELLQRKHANSYIIQLENWIENQNYGLSPNKIVLLSICRLIFLYSLLYFVLFIILMQLFTMLNKINAIAIIANINWTILFTMGLVGAVLALRTKRAYAILLIAIISIFFWIKA